MRLIDAEHLKRWIMLRWESGISVGYDDVKTNEILEQIDRELTINLEPRKKGKWILVTDNRGQHFECDKCGEWRYHQGQNFCSHCGADMRGEQNGTD